MILHPSRLFCYQNNEITHSLRSSPVKSLCFSLLHHAHMFLVGCCIWNIDQRPFKATKFFIFSLLLLSLPPQIMVWRPPNTFFPGCAPSPLSLLPQMPTFGWLLCCPTKRWPPKAKVTSLSLIFDVLRFGTPNKGTNSHESAPNAARLVWAHRDERRQDLGPLQMLSWQKIAKLLKGRAMAGHIGCCLFCVFCALSCVRAAY